MADIYDKNDKFGIYDKYDVLSLPSYFCHYNFILPNTYLPSFSFVHISVIQQRNEILALFWKYMTNIANVNMTNSDCQTWKICPISKFLVHTLQFELKILHIYVSNYMLTIVLIKIQRYWVF